MKEMTLPFKSFKFSPDVKKSFHFRSQGSEAKVYDGVFNNKPAILKERFNKKYRHNELDTFLTAERMRAETRALNRCHEINILCPSIYFVNGRYIILEKITDSITVKEFLKSAKMDALIPLALKIGKMLAIMHKNDLVHGDVTTSNLLLKVDQLNSIYANTNFDLYFIDFGLSKRDGMIEDKAVDLYVLERAISSSHPNSEKFRTVILEQYLRTIGKQASAIAIKLEEVRQRGRKRSMLG